MRRTAIALSTTLAAAVLLVALLPSGAQATGSLLNNGVLVLNFDDASGHSALQTPISADNPSYGFIWTASGGTNTGVHLARYNPDGTTNAVYSPGVDFRSLYSNNAGNLFAKEFGSGAVYSISNVGVATLLYNLNDPEAQSSASLNGPDTELYTMSNGTVRRYNAANGAFLGSFNLIGFGGAELGFPDYVQMETNGSGRILTYSDGNVSEWDLAGNRIGTCVIPISTPDDFNTEWSFGVGSDDLVYLYDASRTQWASYRVFAGATPVAATTWGAIKSAFNPNR